MNAAALVRRTVVIGAALASLQCAAAQPVGDEDKGHEKSHEHPAGALLAFLSGEAHHISGPLPEAQLNEDAPVSADIVLALTSDKFRLFGEYLLSSREHDFERLQVGYEPIADTVFWLGRFHQPASAWNTEHHHGRYLQTAITRPSIELWEDEGGVLPQHLSGLLVESRVPLREVAGLQLELGVGLGPTIEEEGLEPLDVLKANASGRGTSWTGRIAWLPSYLGATQVGLLFASHDMPVADPTIAATLNAGNVQQDMIGGFANVSDEPWRVAAAIYGVRNTLNGPAGSDKESFVAGYVQVERQLQHALTLYGRHENSARADQSIYVAANHQEFEKRRWLAGARWDFLPRQALTVELARGETLRMQQSEYRLQWSAALQ